MDASILKTVPIPFTLNFNNLVIDDTVSFCLAVLFAITINSVGQAFVAISLGDKRPDEETRLHFNPVFYMDPWGLICFCLAGFGWPKYVEIKSEKFKHPRLYTIFARFGGPLANFLLANIAASAMWIMGLFNIIDRVLPIVLIVNLTVAVYSFIPIPPLAGASIINFFYPDKKFQSIFKDSGPIILLIIFAMEFFSNEKVLSKMLDPVVRTVFEFIVKT